MIRGAGVWEDCVKGKSIFKTRRETGARNFK